MLAQPPESAHHARREPAVARSSGPGLRCAGARPAYGEPMLLYEARPASGCPD